MKQSSGYPFGNQVMYLKLIKTKMSKELKLTSVEKWVMKYMNYSLEDIKLNRIELNQNKDE